MNMTTKFTSLALLATMAAAALTPAAMADPQSDKNNMRNLGIGGAAVLGYGLLKHNTTATVLGAAAGGYGAYKYEKDRHQQDEGKRARARYHARQYYYRNHHRYLRHY